MRKYKYQCTGNGTGGLGLVTQTIFARVRSVFIKIIFYQSKALPPLDNAPGHLANLAEVRIPLDVSVVYMPTNITSVLHLCITPLSKKFNTGPYGAVYKNIRSGASKISK